MRARIRIRIRAKVRVRLRVRVRVRRLDAGDPAGCCAAMRLELVQAHGQLHCRADLVLVARSRA